MPEHSFFICFFMSTSIILKKKKKKKEASNTQGDPNLINMYQYNLRKEILRFYFCVSHIMLTVLVRNVFNVFLFVFNVLTEIFFCVIFLKYLSRERVSDFPQEQDGKLCRYKKYFKEYLITVNYSSMHVKRQ